MVTQTRPAAQEFIVQGEAPQLILAGVGVEVLVAVGVGVGVRVGVGVFVD